MSTNELLSRIRTNMKSFSLYSCAHESLSAFICYALEEEDNVTNAFIGINKEAHIHGVMTVLLFVISVVHYVFFIYYYTFKKTIIINSFHN